MRKMFFLLLAGVAVLFSACMSPIKVDETVEPMDVEGSSEIPDMEFIGFKGDANMLGPSNYQYWLSMKKSTGMRNLGSKLQVAGIAVDESYSYFGIYSFQELETYKNKKRYITFVEISDYSLTYSTDELAAWRYFCYASVVCLPIGFMNYHTDTHSKLTANIYVYDTKTRSIFYKDAVVIDEKNKWSGLWTQSSDVERDKLLDYYGTKASNQILERYMKVKEMVRSQNR